MTVWRRLVIAWAVAVTFVAAGLALAEGRVVMVARGRCFDRVDDVPAAPVAVVLGTSTFAAGGRENPFFAKRMDAAFALWRSGRVRALIVSGDNGSRGYDEPSAMREALVRRGVPSERIVCDFAGFRTLDSVVRARDVFGQREVVFVSQRFHNERAVYLARAFGIEAWGFDAEDVPLARAVKTYVRERFARTKAVLDVHVFRTHPKFLGPPVRVPVESSPS